MSRGGRVAAAARAALGARFRPHGREPATGLDCIGLAGFALRAGGWDGMLPTGYALRGGEPAGVATRIEASGLAASADEAPGDLLLFASGPGQLHLGIATDVGLVHACATARRVVERPGVAPWPVLGRWRLQEREG